MKMKKKFFFKIQVPKVLMASTFFQGKHERNIHIILNLVPSINTILEQRENPKT